MANAHNLLYYTLQKRSFMYFDVQYMLGASVRWCTGLDSSSVLVREQYWHLAAHACNCPMVLPNACCNMHTIAQQHANMLCSEAMWCCTALVFLPKSAGHLSAVLQPHPNSTSCFAK
jgi:hypothetical protein